jgi:dihydroorotase
MSQLLIKNGLLIDPSMGESQGDLLLADGKILRHGRRLPPPPGCSVFDAAGLWVFPGFIDVHVHAREPGAEAAETLESAACSAAAGGITSVLLMPNTSPPMASPALLRKYAARAKGLPVNVYFSAAATAGRAGKEPSDLAALKKAGALAFTDDGSCLPGSALAGLIRKAAALGLPLLDHPEDFNRTGAGVAAPAAARRLGLPGIPPEAEAYAVLRDILAAAANGPLHLQHLSLAASVDALRLAKKSGWPVTGETCPHYFFLSERAIKKDDANFKMKPPLRPEADRLAVLRAIADGTIDIIASDHAPHERRLKAKGFSGAPFGITGLETLAALCVTGLVMGKLVSKTRLAQLLSANPAALLGLKNKGSLRPGRDADLTILDPRSSRLVPEKFVSRSANSPFVGRRLTGWPAAAVVAGKIVRRGIC